MVVDFDNVEGKVMSPMKLAHVVLRTNNYTEMVNFYKTFLGGHGAHENPQLSFLTYDDEHHRVAIVNIPGIGPKNPLTCGFEHMSFTFDSLDDLLLAYRQRLAKGIKPHWCVNHGITTSIYYKDPDGNMIETQVDALDPEAANAYMMSPDFAENPLGVDFDPEDHIKRVKAGESVESILKRPNIGPRGIDSVPIDFPVPQAESAEVGA